MHNTTVVHSRRRPALARRPKFVEATCRIERHWPHPLAAAIGEPAMCLACSTHLPPLPTAIAVVEVEGRGIAFVSGICGACAKSDERDLVAVALIAFREVAPSARPVHPGAGAA
jgi:hypothetical protein